MTVFWRYSSHIITKWLFLFFNTVILSSIIWWIQLMLWRYFHVIERQHHIARVDNQLLFLKFHVHTSMHSSKLVVGRGTRIERYWQPLFGKTTINGSIEVHFSFSSIFRNSFLIANFMFFWRAISLTKKIMNVVLLELLFLSDKQWIISYIQQLNTVSQAFYYKPKPFFS